MCTVVWSTRQAGCQADCCSNHACNLHPTPSRQVFYKIRSELSHPTPAPHTWARSTAGISSGLPDAPPAPAGPAPCSPPDAAAPEPAPEDEEAEDEEPLPEFVGAEEDEESVRTTTRGRLSVPAPSSRESALAARWRRASCLMSARCCRSARTAPCKWEGDMQPLYEHIWAGSGG